MADRDRGYRYGWLVIAAVVVLAVAIGWWLSRSPGPDGTYSAQHPITCPSANLDSCYYVKTNKPVSPNPQSVTYNGASVPTVGLLPPQCANTFEACTYLANVGVWQVWNTDPKGTAHLEATYGAPPTQPAGGG